MSARWRVAVLAFALPFAYACGLSADFVVNGDTCLDTPVPETSRFDVVRRWWPGHTDCRVTAPDGASYVYDGDTTVFYATFGFWIVVAVLVVVPGPEWLRAALAGGAAAVALGVIWL